MHLNWPGPLFYPPVGKVAVMTGGTRIEVWANESDPDCFTGLLLSEGNFQKRAAMDLSCFWDRFQIDHVEEPTSEDMQLMQFPGRVIEAPCDSEDMEPA